MESFFASLKKEHVHQARFGTREEARAAVFDYIEVFYNRQRLNSAISYRTPVQARADMVKVASPWQHDALISTLHSSGGSPPSQRPASIWNAGSSGQ
jgi:hypothetical protein